MHYYLYEVKNNLNGKIYVGVHKSTDLSDKYMGSGTVIRNAIKKHGIANFTKTIIETFECAESMYAREKEVVTDEFLARDDVYNLRRGGLGGFDHINALPVDQRPNLISLRQNIASGKTVVGGTRNWTEESKEKAVAVAMRNNELGLTRGWHHTEEYKKMRSIKQTGSSNSQFGVAVYFNSANNQKKRFKIGFQPQGWESVGDIEDRRMASSKRWFNDGVRNYYLVLPNPLVEEKQLIKGRIKTA